MQHHHHNVLPLEPRHLFTTVPSAATHPPILSDRSFILAEIAPKQTLSYSILSDNELGAFAISPTTGASTVAKPRMIRGRK